jgi:AcrR family transcriptional regulator
LATKTKAVAMRAPERAAGALARKQERSEARRRQIFDGALACFEEKGYHQTTLIDIASAAGISTGLIYQYFRDKEDLLYQVILEILEAYNRDIPKALEGVEDPLQRLQRAAVAYYNVVEKRVPASLVAYRETHSLNRQQLSSLKAKELQTNDWILQCILECRRHGYIADETDPELATYWIVATAHSWGLKNWRLRKIVAFEQYVRETLRALLKSMLNDRGRRHLESLALLEVRSV